MSNHCGQQIVKLEDHSFVLDEKLLDEIFLRPEIANRKIVCISIAGAFRTGKSFLLGFFLRYLKAQYVKKDISNWIGDDDAELNGFSWRAGSERNTTGILIWSEIFLHDTKDDSIAIVLLDTQGIFDNQSTAKDCGIIFALSTLISSVQIFNILNRIREDEIQHLQLFTEYGKLIVDNSEYKPFQKLIFLIRDWVNDDEYPYGSEGGKAMLRNILKVSDEQNEELKSIRKYVESCFTDLEGFLMPPPGYHVVRKKNFKGELKHIEDDFKAFLGDLVLSTLAPENLVIKSINGENLKARNFVNYIKIYFQAINSEDIPKPTTMMMASAIGQHLSAFAEARDLYFGIMKEYNDSKKFWHDKKFIEIHENAKDECLTFFNNKKKMGGPELSQEYAFKLTDILDTEFLIYVKNNQRKYNLYLSEAKIKNSEAYEKSLDHYKNEMNKLFANKKFYSKEDLERNHKNALETSITHFSELRIGEYNLYNEFEEKLKTSIKSSLEDFEKLNNDFKIMFENLEKGKCINNLHKATTYFSDEMTKILRRGCLAETALINNGEVLRKKAIDMFKDGLINNSFYSEYEKRLNEEFLILINSKIKTLRNRPARGHRRCRRTRGHQSKGCSIL